MYLDGVFPEKIYNTRWVQGMTAPLVCTGIGKAMLAFMLVKCTENTITDPEALREELMLTRERGYSIDNMEHEYGIKCVGVPEFDQSGKPVGAMSTAGSSLRFSEEQIPVFAEMLKEKAEIIKRSI